MTRPRARPTNTTYCPIPKDGATQPAGAVAMPAVVPVA